MNFFTLIRQAWLATAMFVRRSPVFTCMVLAAVCLLGKFGYAVFPSNAATELSTAALGMRVRNLVGHAMLANAIYAPIAVGVFRFLLVSPEADRPPRGWLGEVAVMFGWLVLTDLLTSFALIYAPAHGINRQQAPAAVPVLFGLWCCQMMGWYFSVRLALVGPQIAIKRKETMLERSWIATRHHFWRCWGSTIVPQMPFFTLTVVIAVLPVGHGVITYALGRVFFLLAKIASFCGLAVFVRQLDTQPIGSL